MAKESQVFYRKYRPSAWDEVIGQEHIVSVLAQSIKNQTFSHAYLFTGSRGTGKTTLARIFAAELGTNPEDIIEIDAASNRGVEDIDALRSGVRVLPFSSPFKVYIIDEVHMLSSHAFNALLKTLEEPPAHVIFILATTELDKVPETILSRCQVFSFRKPSETVLATLVETIAKKEKLTVDSESATLIAFLGDGSFRDTLGILQKVASASDSRAITRELVEKVTGAPSLVLLRDLYTALIEKNIDLAYKTLRDAEANHIDMMLLAELLLGTMRLSLMYRYAPTIRAQIEGEHSHEYVEIIKRGAVENTETISSRGIVALITAIERIAYAAIPTLPLELAFVEMTEAETTSKE
ncbi:MAG TPA: DNA polymerase III subunit gamma/tau [Candidatus Paceibacterota bacterium]|nr:DNA polymerase III subunit gamma/tau [Candidatus Paceibacterota bacterium]